MIKLIDGKWFQLFVRLFSQMAGLLKKFSKEVKTETNLNCVPRTW
jgi:hypothetical protein